MSDFLIVGAGVFGLTTALALAQTQRDARITIVDRATASPYPSAASSDVNKIVRADYGDLFYMKLALEALEKWNNDPFWKPYFHRTGILLAEDFGMGRDSKMNYEKLGIETGARVLTPVEALEEFKYYTKAHWAGVDELFYNPQGGWGDADGGIRAMREAITKAGVEYIQASVTSLVFEDDYTTCTGVKTSDGRVISGKSILLATGAWTAKLIADSAPHVEALQVNGRLVAAAATSVLVDCDPAYRHLYEGAPVHVLSFPHTRGESVPINSNNKLKFNFENSFTNKQYHELSGQTISSPPLSIGQSTWSHEIPEELKKNCRNVIKNVWGENAPGLTIESYRMCWDAITPDQDFVITQHPACKNLSIASGGSFHSWKMLPVIGDCVARMLLGKLTAEEARKWAWDRDPEGTALVIYIPKKDLHDFEGFESAL